MNQPLLFRPESRIDVRQVRPGLALGFGALILGIAVFAIGPHKDLAVLSVAMGLMILGGLGYVVAFLTRTNIRIGGQILTEMDVFGRQRSVDLSLVQRAARQTVRVPLSATPMSVFWLIDVTGEPVLRLNTRAWSPSTLDEICAAAGVSPSVLVADRAVAVREVRRVNGRLLHWWEGQTILLGCLIAIALIVGPILLHGH